METTVRRGFVVSGRVQGVGFRWWTVRAAERHGLAGTVRNQTDGTVEVMVAGPASGVDALALDLWRGPAFAKVEGVEEVPCVLPSEPSGFTITG